MPKLTILRVQRCLKLPIHGSKGAKIAHSRVQKSLKLTILRVQKSLKLTILRVCTLEHQPLLRVCTLEHQPLLRVQKSSKLTILRVQKSSKLTILRVCTWVHQPLYGSVHGCTNHFTGTLGTHDHLRVHSAPTTIYGYTRPNCTLLRAKAAIHGKSGHTRAKAAIHGHGNPEKTGTCPCRYRPYPY